MTISDERQTPGENSETPVWWEFGVPWAVFSLLGGIQLLAVAQAVWVDLDFTLALERILGANDEFLRWVSGPIDPLARAVIDWLNARFDWSFTLHDHWRALAALALVFVLAIARNLFRIPGNRVIAVQTFFVVGGFTVIGALIAGLAPIGAAAGDWPLGGRAGAHGLAAAAPVSFTILGMAVMSFLDAISRSDSSFSSSAKEIGFLLVAALGFGAFTFALGALLAATTVGFVRDGSGPIVLGVTVAVTGGWAMFVGRGWRRELAERNEDAIRIGLCMLGGFSLAALVWGTDFTYRVLTG